MKKLLSIIMAILIVMAVTPMTFALDVHTHSVSVNCAEQENTELFIPLTQEMIDAMDGYWYTIYNANYYLAEDIVIPNYIVARLKSNLCLNGHSITAVKEGIRAHTMPVIDVYGDSTFSICDCKGGGKLIGTGKGSTTGILLRDNAAVNFYGGNICIDSETAFVGVYLSRGSVFNMYAGSIYSDNYGVQSPEGATINLYAGKVGGGNKNTFLSANSTLNAADGVLCDCMCHEEGFLGFIWKIINLFQKLFGTNPVCECSRAHY